MIKRRIFLLSLCLAFWVINPPGNPAGDARAMIALPRPDSLLGPVSAQGLVVVAYGNPSAISIAAYDAEARLHWRRELPSVSFSGELKACQDLVYAPAFTDGVYVFGARDGSLKAHLLPGMGGTNPLLACTPQRVCVRIFRARTSAIIAFDATTFREVWKREFPERHISDLRAVADVFDVVVARGTVELPHDQQVITLRAKDGRRLSVRPAPELPLKEQWDSLPPRVRARLRGLFIRREGTQYVNMTPAVLSKDLLAIGRPYGARAALFVMRARTGRMVWQRDAPGLFGIVRVSYRLVALYAEPDMAYPDSAKRLDWLDFRTGRLLRSVRLK